MRQKKIILYFYAFKTILERIVNPQRIIGKGRVYTLLFYSMTKLNSFTICIKVTNKADI
jgi:hypothetical protein